jgi:hypothetical protein
MTRTSKVFGLAKMINLTFRPLNPKAASDGRSYFRFKCPYLQLSGKALL